MNIDQYIYILSKCYFWVFIVVFILNFLYSLGDEYKKREEIAEKLGKAPMGISYTGIFYYTLFVFSCIILYYY